MGARGIASQADALRVQTETTRARLQAELDVSRAQFLASQEQVEAVRARLEAELGASRQNAEAALAQSAAALAAAERRAADLEAEVERLRAVRGLGPLCSVRETCVPRCW